MSLLLVPATRENLEKSIEISVDISFARKHLGEDFTSEILRLSGNEGIRCWAVTKNRRQLFENIHNGDEVLLTEKNTGCFTHYGVVIGKIQSASFGNALWPLAGENPWEYIYFLANITRIRTDKSEFVRELGYNDTYIVPGSMMVKAEYYAKVGAISERFEIPVFEYISEAIEDSDYSGSDIQATAKRRVGHASFSRTVKGNYQYSCAICGITEPEFLIAGHISTWAEDICNRLNPSNGICLCSLHDKSFEHGYISLDDEYRVVLNSRINRNATLYNELCKYENTKIRLPVRNPPNKKILMSHRKKHNI